MRPISGPYADWVDWLRAFGRGVDLPGGHLPSWDAELGPQLVTRLTQHVAEAFHNRQRRWSEALHRDQEMLVADPRHAAAALAVVLAGCRSRLAPLVALAVHPALPEQLRESLRAALTETVHSAQRSLRDSARELPLDLQAVIRANELLPALTRPSPAPAGTAPRRRRVILD
ncbi:hypothetical protein LWP59_24870 [Amycolatopsis acidiphila]|uniref:Uncharacterized protein n=1 Tax=Amycolatopsis acidiphila TaxID=715473 RepID=A0A558ALM4_9PSEU|nr:hypothetical protein [Amycolatopsis acidiphila]TVT25111.1 hypothetical protein FNH06_04660 [Amycolatopsis acidiphila]UIJ57377.1 hypothetical protein LWP59_24870 [Amycolatopsis acidiphila]GHG84543.1 hypothetical protein GCM10017788_56650 [Amycolatopsis acidiphila]